LGEGGVAAAADGDGEEAQGFIQDPTIMVLEETMAGMSEVVMEDMSEVAMVVVVPVVVSVAVAVVEEAAVAAVLVAVSNYQ
jgi:hypothetical protein